MAILKVDTISGIGTEGPVFEGDVKFTSQNFLTLPKGDTTQRISTSSGISTETGAVRYNTDSNKMEVYIGSTWMEVAVSSPNLDGGARGLHMGGANPTNDVVFVTIPTAGNAIDFGDLITARYLNGGCSSRIRALTFGGNTPSVLNSIEFHEFSSTGNFNDFGDMVSAKRNLHGGGNQTRGLMCGGLTDPSYKDEIDFVTIASAGDAVDFGNLTVARTDAETASNGSRMVIYAAYAPTATNVMDFVTIASQGDAQDFGDAADKQNGRAASGDSSIRGVFMGGRYSPSPSQTSDIQLITIASRGNSVKFGDLATEKKFPTGTSSKTRALCIGGATPTALTDIEYVTIATEGNAVDFGDLLAARYSGAAASNDHGGL